MIQYSHIGGNVMKLVYNESLTKNVIENYFRTYEDIDGEVTIKTGCKKVSNVGRSISWYEVPTIQFILKGSMEVEGEMQPVEIAVSEAEVENAFTTMVEASGRQVKRVSIDFDEVGLKTITVDAIAKRKVKH